jgi:hypothetical protein
MRLAFGPAAQVQPESGRGRARCCQPGNDLAGPPARAQHKNKRASSFFLNQSIQWNIVPLDWRFAPNTLWSSIFATGRSTPVLRTPAQLRPALGHYAEHLGPALALQRGQPPSTAKTLTLGSDWSTEPHYHSLQRWAEIHGDDTSVLTIL